MTNIAALLAPFSSVELERAGLDYREVGRWRSGGRIPSDGPSVRQIAAALVLLRAENDLPSGDLAAVIQEVAAAASADRKARRERRTPA